jgi:ubiquinone/menaquinone biosynthesis C-methylase UbiE
MADPDNVQRHYALINEGTDLVSAVESALDAHFGANAELKVHDLAPLDEFHIGGREATQLFFDALGLSTGWRVADLGAGIGGGARLAASEHGCIVQGVDLTPEYCELANRLSARVGLADRVHVDPSDACATPYEASHFDAVYTMHVSMNIEDKLALYKEAYRLLKPGGRFGLYDVMQGTAPDPLAFPVPWATSAEASHLISPQGATQLLEQTGFKVEQVTDRTPYALEFFERLRAASSGGPPPIGLHLLMGAAFPLKLKNMVENVSAGRCGPWLILAGKPE